jgi:hypothetical protein
MSFLFCDNHHDVIALNESNVCKEDVLHKALEL